MRLTWTRWGMSTAEETYLPHTTSSKGENMSTIVTQDVTAIRKLEGQRRLLAYN